MRTVLLNTLRLAGLYFAACSAPAMALAGEVRFSPDDGHAYHPVWSADGKYIAFEVNRYSGGSIDMFVAEVTGAIAKDGHKVLVPGGTSQFGGAAQVVINPGWMKQGAVVFEGSSQGTEYRLYSAFPKNPMGSELLTTKQAPSNLSFPSWSSDGASMAYISAQTGNGDIRVWNRSTNAIAQITSSEATEVFPLFSSDGQNLLFTRKSNNTEDIFQYSFVSKAEAKFVSGGGDQTRPVYAANGDVVYFTSERSGDTTTLWDVAAIDPTGQNKRILAKDVRLPLRGRPALTADGAWVAWVSSDPTRDNKVMLTKLDGSKTIEVKTEFKACGEPAVTAQAGRVLLAFTYLPQSGADWRHLRVQDISDKF